MKTQRFGVATTVFVEAFDAAEAALVVERDLAGRFDNEFVSISAYAKGGDGSRCPACGSERIEHHEDIVPSPLPPGSRRRCVGLRQLDRFVRRRRSSSSSVVR